MKKRIIWFLAVISCFFLSVYTEGQVRVNFNIGLQPLWGPVGYDYVEYYYLPDIDVYYNVPRHEYVYYDGGRWVTTVSLPPRYHDYDLYTGYKVVVNEREPYLHHEHYKEKYARYKGRHDQEVIRNSHESKYFEIKEHPEHGKWKGNGEGKGHGHGHGHGD